MQGNDVFWAGEGCVVRPNGAVVGALAVLARELDVDLFIPRTDGVTQHDVDVFTNFASFKEIRRFSLCSLNAADDPRQPVIQIPGDDGIFVLGEEYITRKRPFYKDRINLLTPFEEKEDCLYWVGGFSGRGRRWRLVERMAGITKTKVLMTKNWCECAPEFVAEFPSLVVDCQPLSTLGGYQKLLSIDGNGVGGNSTLNALLDVVYVFHGSLKPMWMHSAKENVHYLQIRDDFSNLQEVMDSLDDPILCQELRLNLNQHMRAFVPMEQVLSVLITDILRVTESQPNAAPSVSRG